MACSHDQKRRCARLVATSPALCPLPACCASWWAYALLALLDVEANFCVVLAYRYTSLTRRVLGAPGRGPALLHHLARWPLCCRLLRHAMGLARLPAAMHPAAVPRCRFELYWAASRWCIPA